MSKKEFNPLEWKNKKPESSQCSESSERPIRPISHISPIRPIVSTIEEEIEQLVCAVESSCKDIAPDYTSWRDLAFALADALGESGRSYFHRLSRFYPGYDEREADKQFSACLRSHGSGITINTLFHLAKEAGVLMIRNSVKPYNVKKTKSYKSSSEDMEDLEDLSDLSEMPESSQCSESSEPLPTFSQEIYSLLPSLLTSVINKSNNFEDADILILGSLTVISACLPNISGHYAEREVFPNLFTFISAQASAGKGRLTLCRHLVKPIHNNLKKIYSAEMEEYRHLLNDYSQDKKNREPPQEPPIKTLLIPANSSATSVYQVLNDNGGVGLIFETEGDTLANTFKSDYGNFSDGFRKAFHHEMISYTRRKDREFVELTKPRLSALLSGTPKQILALIPDAENGLFSRFIFYNMNLRLEWRDVFSESAVSLDDYFIDLGQRYFQFYQTLQQSQPIKFSLTINQQIEFNKFFTEIQQEYSSLFGLDIVASVRRLGLITFRVAMILTSLRIMDGKSIESVIVCDDVDFRTSLIMARVLLQHTAHVFGQLPSTDSNATRGTVTVLCQTFFDSLPSEFNRRTYLSIAERLHVAPKTAEKYIRKFCTTGQLKHLAHDSYSKM
ncbi:MAG: DUF3987 domain-containing protein [Bacteroidales bacterium]|nr:DUF3987 domain-containing protein [Bacteroidales bacterium]